MILSMIKLFFLKIIKIYSKELNIVYKQKQTIDDTKTGLLETEFELHNACF